MVSTDDKTDSLVEKDRKCIWHPFTQMQTTRPPILISHAKGAYLYGPDGRAYLDGIASWWVNLHGHAHPYISKKIREQAEKLEHVIFADFTHAPAIELAARLLPLLPGHMSRIFYTDNGSTAVEAAIKMAIQYWYNRDSNTRKTKVIGFRNGYHGDTFGAMSVAGKNGFNQPFWKHLFEIECIDPPVEGKEEQSLAQLQAILEKEGAACLIFEPLIMGAGGMVIYPAAGLDRLLKLCHRYGVLTIADEVMTGFGRTGTLFACDQLDEAPDIICLSKGITGGFLPLGATACKEEIYKAFLGNTLQQAFLHGHSYTANPLACSSALASLDLLQLDMCSRQRAMIAACHAQFCEKWRGHPKLRRCESLGTVLALEYHSESSHSYFLPFGKRLYNFFLEKEVILRPLGNVLYVLPPYCILEAELHLIYDHIESTLKGDL